MQDEVRTLGIALGVEEFSVWRHPFPGPGLAIRCLDTAVECLSSVFDTVDVQQELCEHAVCMHAL
eukprot:6242-Heterococcus_DN1.PRE.3